MAKGKAVKIELRPEERQRLELLLVDIEKYCDRCSKMVVELLLRHYPGGRYGPETASFHLLILKLKTALLAADGQTNAQISEELEVCEKTIGVWRNRFSYILKRDDLPSDRIYRFFWFSRNPVKAVVDRKPIPKMTDSPEEFALHLVRLVRWRVKRDIERQRSG